MSEQKIEFVRLDWSGKLVSVGGEYWIIRRPKFVEAQQRIQGTKRQVDIARGRVAAKLADCSETLEVPFLIRPLEKMRLSAMKGEFSE